MDYVPTADERLSEVNAALKVVGRLPRILHGALLALFVPFAFLVGNLDPFVLLLGIGAPLVMFALSLRIKAHATREALIVRSYLWTCTARYEDVLGFADASYAGYWTSFIAADWGINRGLRMISVVRFKRMDIDLPATLMGRRSSRRIEELLSAWVPDEMPPDWVP